MSFLGSLRTWLLFNNKINPQKYNLPNNSALPVSGKKKNGFSFRGVVIYYKVELSEHLDVRVREVRPNFAEMFGFGIRTRPELRPEPEPH